MNFCACVQVYPFPCSASSSPVPLCAWPLPQGAFGAGQAGLAQVQVVACAVGPCLGRAGASEMASGLMEVPATPPAPPLVGSWQRAGTESKEVSLPSEDSIGRV